MLGSSRTQYIPKIILILLQTSQPGIQYSRIFNTCSLIVLEHILHAQQSRDLVRHHNAILTATEYDKAHMERTDSEFDASIE
jgi:hypothetical protein